MWDYTAVGAAHDIMPARVYHARQSNRAKRIDLKCIRL